jgi:hypothetical protein
MKVVEEELTTSNRTLQKKLEVQDAMEKDMNVSTIGLPGFFTELGLSTLALPP